MGLAERVWLRVPSRAKEILLRALESGFSTFVLDEEDVKRFASLGRYRALTTLRDDMIENGARVGSVARIASVADQDRALALVERGAWMLVDATSWRIIPYENLIAACHARGAKLVAVARDAEDARLLLATLEKGVDAVLLAPATSADVTALAAALAEHAPRVELSRARIVALRAVASGDRACVDTASLLAPGEGILVGSSAQALFLVHAETLESGYVAARPFRVNAGPVHAYVLLADGRTKYLSELRAGDEVLAVARDGATRTVVVGRVKVETRPLVLVEAEVAGARIHTLLQNAETIRLTTPSGAKSVSELARGDEVLVRIERGGRHFGTPVDERIEER
ncbi:MAG: 3-dehydroquinate synthase II [Thermoplasmatota archaeon]